MHTEQEGQGWEPDAGINICCTQTKPRRLFIFVGPGRCNGQRTRAIQLQDQSSHSVMKGVVRKKKKQHGAVCGGVTVKRGVKEKYRRKNNSFTGGEKSMY